MAAGRSYSYFVDLKDPSNTPAAFTLRVDLAPATGARVKLFRGSTDVTAAVKQGHYSTGVIQPWSMVTFEFD